jgi:hypothetical protein
MTSLRRDKRWTPIEDALIFHSYYSSPKRHTWKGLANHLPCRSEKSIKLRFHHVKKCFETEAARLRAAPNGIDPYLRTKIFTAAQKLNVPFDLFHDLVDLLCFKLMDASQLVILRINSIFDLTDLSQDECQVLCSRCLLIVPSTQTGDKRCTKTGWCRVCCGTPAYFFGEILRMHHNLCSRKRTIEIKDP